MLQKIFILHCDQRIILFINEILHNILSQKYPVADKRAFVRFKDVIQSLLNLGDFRKGKFYLSKRNLAKQRIVLSSPKGLSMILLLNKTIEAKHF